MDAKKTYQAPALKAADELVSATRAQLFTPLEPNGSVQGSQGAGAIGFGL
jgi:hypothetical protein